MPEKKPLPIGTEFFDELRKNEYYYVDKTGLIVELLRSPSKVTLFTRPRRFGKTLAMTTLKSFFEIGADSSLFDGLEISREKELCERHMGKYPVVFVSLKGVDAVSFTRAREQMGSVIAEMADRLSFLERSGSLEEGDKERFRVLRHYSMTEQAMTDSFRTICRLLEKHYGRKVVLLIDEYDVPLQKAFYAGYYDEMVELIRSMFAQALKTNDSLERAVLTGCLRISKESIFTGMNNLRVLTVSDPRFCGYFGFTDREVRQLLEYYGLPDAWDVVREWYDGYRFGNQEIYCPWDVINYIDLLRTDPQAPPQNFWANSSSNDAVREFVRRLDTKGMAGELEALVAGETVAREIRQELTYREMYTTVENLWSLLYMTGYLTAREQAGSRLMLTIPNMEIREIFRRQIMDLFRENTEKDGETVSQFAEALRTGDAVRAEELLDGFLRRTVSIRDTFVKRELQENFYHGILLGILGFKGGWYVTSNYETGDGNLEKGAEQALAQIEKKRYDDVLRDEGCGKIWKYGIACYKKRCRVALAVPFPQDAG